MDKSVTRFESGAVLPLSGKHSVHNPEPALRPEAIPARLGRSFKLTESYVSDIFRFQKSCGKGLQGLLRQMPHHHKTRLRRGLAIWGGCILFCVLFSAQAVMCADKF